jgi:hypothetical protein
MPDEPTVENRRKGKIARLPHDLRLMVNTMLSDNKPAAEIITELAEQHVEGINEVNIHNWFVGGYQDWMRDQERISELSARRDAAMEMVNALKRDGTMTLADANDAILAGMVNEALEKFDVASLVDLMHEEPKQFLQFANVINSQSNEQRKREKVELEYKKYRDQVEAAKEKILAVTTAAKSKGGITPETLRDIEEQANLL